MLRTPHRLRIALFSLPVLLASTLPAQNAHSPGPARVSAGVMAGSLLTKVNPVYPPIAKAAQVQGTVVLRAIIGKDGTIKNLTVVSGHPMLQNAATDAVKQWTYKPFMLNGVATEVDTTITVNFSLNLPPAVPAQQQAVASTNPASIEAEANALYGANNYSEALSKYEQAAALGSVTSQIALGAMYERGLGTPQDQTKSFFWYNKAAQQGSAVGEFALGLKYFQGVGTTQDDQQAFSWLLKAAEQGEPRAESSIGTLYFLGRGTPKDLDKAMLWYHSAADHGNKDAQNQLAKMDTDAQNQALQARLAAEQNQANIQHPPALTARSYTPPATAAAAASPMTASSPQDPTQLSIEDAIAQGEKALESGAVKSYHSHAAEPEYRFEKLAKRAGKGDAVAAFLIGIDCLKGYGEVDENKKICPSNNFQASATEWLQKAATLGFSEGEGEAQVSTIFSSSHSVYYHPKLKIVEDDKEALFWLKRSAAHGDKGGLAALASYLARDKGNPHALEEAFSINLFLANHGESFPRFTVATDYLMGRGTPMDKAKGDSMLEAIYNAAISYNSLLSDAYVRDVSDAYFEAGDNNKGLYYLIKAAQMPPYYDQGQNAIYTENSQAAYQKLGEIYQAGVIVPQNLQYAQACFDAKQQLANQEAAQEAQNNAQDQANAERNREANSAMISGALSNLNQSIQSLNRPSPIQTAANTQLANINAEQQRAQQVQAQLAQTAAVPKPQTYAAPAPPKPASQTVQQATTPANTQICPPSGIVPGPGHYAACDAYIGQQVSCVPGQPVAIAVPPPPPASCGPVNTPAANLNTPAVGSGEGNAMGCMIFTPDNQGNVNVQNNCPFTVHYYWVGYNDPNSTKNDVVQAGGTDQFSPGGQYRIYACNNAYFTDGPDGRIVHGIVDNFMCVKK